MSSFCWLATTTITLTLTMQLINTGTFKTALVVSAAVSIVLILSLLIVESRSVKDEYYVAHAERTRAMESIEADIATASEEMQIAFATGSGVPLSTELAFARLVENDDLIQALVTLPRSDSQIPSPALVFDDTLHQFVASGLGFTGEQNALAESLQSIQDESPSLVKELRELGTGEQSQLVFALAIDLIEFATDQNRSDGGSFDYRIAQLSESASAAKHFPGFLQTAKSIVNHHTAAGATLKTINSSTLVADLAALNVSFSDANRTTVSRAERARLLLSICAVLLLLGAGYAIFRLQASYRELNQSNSDLEQANLLLEERVAHRTEELSCAFDDLKESQTQLIHAEKMSSLGQMVAGISHEINTPLWYLMSNSSVIQERLELVTEFCDIGKNMIAAVRSQTAVGESIRRGLVDMQRLLRDGMEDDIEEAKSLVEDSISGLEELTALAQGLKDFSRLDRAAHGLYDVNEGLDKSLLIASNKIKNRVNVHKYYCDVPSIYCTPSQINQIFLNLLTNAADAIEGSGELVIQTWEEDGNVGISISDTGSGIPADVLPKIRDPFFTTKEVGKGTGLGLSIVDKIITTHHGEFRIESVAGEGTTVTVLLPVSAPPTPAIEFQSGNSDAQVIEVAPAFLQQNGRELPEELPKLLSA